MPDFYKLNVAETLAELQTNVDTGLTDEMVSQRQAEHGKNVLPTEGGMSLIKLILSQFTDLMVIILIIAAVVSAFLGDTKDVVVILAIVVLNAILGTYQEYQAEKALAALGAMQVPLVRVRRNRQVQQISAEDLVPGDIVILAEGDRIPADGRIIQSINLQIEEAALTGESIPVEKVTAPIKSDQPVALGDRTNMAFMGTNVNFGRGELLVTGTGLKTELGNIAALLMQVEQGITPLQRRLNTLGKMLASGAGVIVVIVFITGLLRGIPWEEMFLTAISLAVAAVPEGLPALITISLSLGAGRMVRRNALIRRLPAVETLGSVTVICSDKTGTLTKNEMTVVHVSLPGHPDVKVSGTGYSPEGEFRGEAEETVMVESDPLLQRFLDAIAISTNAYLQPDERKGGMSVVGDTTEGALLVAAQKGGLTREQLEKELPRVNELPFSSERKAMTTVHEVVGNDAKTIFPDTRYISITKGAPDQLIEWGTHEIVPDGAKPLTPERRKAWHAEIGELAEQGLRVLGIAYRPLENNPDKVTPEIERELYLLGLVGILDPARPEAKAAVRTAREAGIRSVMITGDHALTAEAIAADLGIIERGQKAVTGADIEKMSEEQLLETVKTTSAFARVSPEHKLRLVKALQSQGHIAAMTGDGVNDAPALKQADIGVAMGITGTDVSKGAADMVLTDDNFASIVAAVEEGRVIYDNIRKFIRYVLSSNVSEILVMFIALLAGLKIPLLAIQILWINLVTDGLPAIAMGFEPGEPGVMKRPPRPMSESIFAGGMGRQIIWIAILLTILTLGSYMWGYASHNMNPLSPTLGLEHLSREELVEVVGDVAPADWDAMSEEARSALLLAEERGEGGHEEVSGGILGVAERIPRTIAFMVLALGQIFHVAAIHAGDRISFFKVWFKSNPLLMLACISTFILQLAVIYIPFLQDVFETEALSLGELAITIAVASLVLFAIEVEKLISNRGKPLAAAT